MNRLTVSLYFLSVLLLLNQVSPAQTNNHQIITKNKEPEMPVVKKNKEIIARLYEQCLNKRELSLLDDYISEAYTGLQGKKGAAGFLAPVQPLLKAFPDIQWQLNELIGESDKVFVKWSIKGTHTGSFTNIEATGKEVINTGMAIYQLEAGKVISTQVMTDRLSFLQQLEVLPLDLSLLTKSKTPGDKVSFIDKFFVPAAAKKVFYERMRLNRDFIKALPGFIEDAVYTYTDDNGNLSCVTVAAWENREALNKAREAVQAEYKKQGLDMAEMLKKLNITTDRGVYTELPAHQ